MDSMQELQLSIKHIQKLHLCYVTGDNVLFSIESITKQVSSYRDFESNGLL